MEEGPGMAVMEQQSYCRPGLGTVAEKVCVGMCLPPTAKAAFVGRSLPPGHVEGEESGKWGKRREPR